MSADRGHLQTEQRNARARDIDALSVADAFGVMAAEDASIPAAVDAAKAEICAAVELVVAAWRRGGRLLYAGAGTSGRLGVLDASECPPTFGTDPELVQGVIAGGDVALRRSVEGAEDDAQAGAAAMQERGVRAGDVVCGITAGGTTPFVRGALRRARELGAKTIFLACVPREQVPDDADVSIRVVTGAEVLAGSTRLKAGTATKIVLNRITTLGMIRFGKVYGDLMVDVNARACDKLRDRGVRILQAITDLDRASAAARLAQCDGEVKTALVAQLLAIGPHDARKRLAAAGGSVRAALEEHP